MKRPMDKMFFRISAKWQLRLFLLFAPGILAEILSGNTPILKLTNPVDLFFLILAYGVPALLIWEYKVKYSLSFLSVFLLGLAYGIFNEGLIAKTILESSPIPTGGFQMAPGFFGLNIEWALMILPWHAFYSILFPIVLAHVFFPEQEDTSLIGNRWKYVFLITIFIVLPFIAKGWQGVISPTLYILFYSLILVLFFLARSLPKNIQKATGGKGFIIGIGSVFLYVVLFAQAGKMPVIFYVSMAIVFFGALLWSFLRLTKSEQAKFALGGYISFGGFATLATLIVGRIDLLGMWIFLNGILYFWLKKKGHF